MPVSVRFSFQDQLFQGVHWLDKHSGVLHQLSLSLQASQRSISWALVSEIFFWLWWNSCQSMIVNNSSFFQGWCSHSWKERVDTTQRGFQVIIFIDICFFSSDVSFPYYVCFVRKMSLYDFQRWATSSRLLLWRCRGHPQTWGWSQLNITWSRFVSNMVKYDHPVCLKYTLIKIIETTTLARWSGTRPLRTVWQSTDQGKLNINFFLKKKLRKSDLEFSCLAIFQKSQGTSV